MATKRLVRCTVRGLAYGATLAVGAYAAYIGATWLRYGRVQAATGDDRDPLLDRFMPAYEIVERHHVRVKAPPDITFETACEVDFQQSPLIRTIFKGRELLLGSDPDATAHPRGILALTQSLGWGVLDRVPQREVVVGAVTQPWKANVVFRAVSPDEFLSFNEPDYVKIAWTLRADPIGANESIARTETRVMTTDPAARRKFRRYWAAMSPGIVIIRGVALRLVRTDAERRAREIGARNSSKTGEH